MHSVSTCEFISTSIFVVPLVNSFLFHSVTVDDPLHCLVDDNGKEPQPQKCSPDVLKDEHKATGLLLTMSLSNRTPEGVGRSGGGINERKHRVINVTLN